MRATADDRLPIPPDRWEPAPLDGRDRRHPVPWEWFDAALVYLAWVLVSGVVAVGVVTATGAEGDAAIAQQVLASVLLLTALTAAWVHLRGRQVAATADATGGMRAVLLALGPKRPTLRDVGIGVGYGLAAFLVVQVGVGLLLSSLIGALGREVPQIQEEVQGAVQGSGVTPLLVVAAVALLAPLGEELLYRGVLYQALAKRLPGWPALGLTGLAFGLTHLEPFVVVLTFPLGMLLAYAMRRHGTLVVPYVAHAVFNGIGVVLIRAGIGQGA